LPRQYRQYENLDAVLATSKTPDDAAISLGVSRSAVYRILKRKGKKPPATWTARVYRSPVPAIIIPREVDRAWVAGLIGGDGSISANYIIRRDETVLLVIVRMTDKEWVSRFAEITQSTPPGFVNRASRRNSKNLWEKSITGIRALRLVQEIMPYLVGGKREEAKRALEFFSPTGYRKGLFRNSEIWPHEKFPLRRTGGRRPKKGAK